MIYTPLKILKLHDDPEFYDMYFKKYTIGSEYSAGIDLMSYERAVVCKDGIQMIHTGIAVEIPEGYFGGIYARSGLSVKHAIHPINCVGVIDSDYRGEIIVPLYKCNSFNAESSIIEINKGDRIAQLIIQPYLPVYFCDAESLTETERGVKAFGQSGVATYGKKEEKNQD